MRVVAGVFYATREASVEKHMSNSPEHYRHPRTPGRFDENRTLASEQLGLGPDRLGADQPLVTLQETVSQL